MRGRWLTIVWAALALALELPGVERNRKQSLVQNKEAVDKVARNSAEYTAKTVTDDGDAESEHVAANEQEQAMLGGQQETDAKKDAETEAEKATREAVEAAEKAAALSAKAEALQQKEALSTGKKKKEAPYSIFANAATDGGGQKSGNGQLNVLLGPAGLQQQIQEQEAEELEEKEQENRPYWLQVIHDMLAPLRLPVIRGHPPALLQSRSKDHSNWRFLPATSFTHLPKTMAQRLSVQDMAVLMAVIIFYLSTILIALSLVYHSSAVSSGVKWFCEPELFTCSSGNFFDFMATFNRPPETRVRVLITNRLGTRKRLDLLLDVTPLCGEGPRAAMIEQKDEKSIRNFIASKNPLSTLIIQKNVVWGSFEELRERIEQRVKEQGFHGRVAVTLERSRDVAVRRNTQLFHFVHSQITLILVLMSIVGLFMFWPFVWLRRQNWYATSTFVIESPADAYMQLVEQALPDAVAQAEESDSPTQPDGASEEGRRARWPRERPGGEQQSETD